LFLRLVSLSDAGAPVSHRLRRGDVVQDQRYDEVVDALVAARLLTADAENVEVAHEALGRAWPRLRTWLEEDREGQRILRHLAASATEWERSGRDEAELYRGGRLRSAEEWMEAAAPDLTVAEREFVKCSRRRQQAEEEDVAAQAERQRRANRRLRVLVAGTGVLLVVALISGGLFLRQRNRADAAAHEAARTAREATARRLATESTVALDQDPELGILLALRGIDVTRSAGEAPLAEALSALQRATQASRLLLRRDDAAFYVDASADGALLATGAVDDHVVQVRDASSGDQLRTLAARCPPGAACAGPYIGDVVFSPSGQLVAVAYQYDDADAPVPTVVLWDARTGAEVSRLLGPARYMQWLAFSPDGRLLAGASVHEGTPDRVTVWDVASATERYSFEPATGAGPVAFRDDPPSLVVAGTEEAVGFYSVDDGRALDSLPTPGLEVADGMALDPTGDLLALASQKSKATHLWDLRSRQRVWSIDGEAGPVRWSPGGNLIAIAGATQSPVRVVDARSGEERMVLRGHGSGSWDVAFTPRGELASVAQVSGLRIWDVTDDGPPALRAVASPSGFVNVAQFSPDGSEMVVFTRDGTMERIATKSGEVVGSLSDQLVGVPTYFPGVSYDWRFVATAAATDGRTVVRSLQTLEPVGEIDPCASPLALSPDGSLLVLDGLGPCTPRFGGSGGVEPTAGSVLRSRVVDAHSGKEILDLGERGVSHALFNPQGRFPAGRFLVVDIDNDTLEIYDMSTRTLISSLNFRDNFVWGLSFDPQGRWLAGGGGGGHAWVLDFAAVVDGKDGKDATVFDKLVDQGGTASTSLSANGLLATAGSGDGRVKLWDVSSGEALLELATTAPATAPMAFSPDGSYLTYNDGGVLRRYLLDPERLVELAQSRLTRGFTPDECRRYLDASDCE
jgi:WD40 repeat protein